MDGDEVACRNLDTMDNTCSEFNSTLSTSSKTPFTILS